MTDPDTHVRTVLYLPRPLYGALVQAADDADEFLPDALRARLAPSLTLPMTAARSGCAGDGEGRDRASPDPGA